MCGLTFAAERIGAQTCAPAALRRTLDNPAPTADDYFGISVAISGNLAVVGAYADDPGAAPDAGTAYVFDASTGATQATLSSPAATASDYFGWSVAISGNLAVIGAYGDAPGGVFNQGSAYVFNALTGAVAATLNNPAPQSSDSFGYSVAISGNLAVVGAYLDDPGGVGDVGTAYVFDATTGTLTATLNNPAPDSGDYFGDPVAIDGNLAVVGARLDSPGGIFRAGAAYVFNATTGALVATLNHPAPAAQDFFGASVAISGNLALVGAYLDEPGATSDEGMAYVFNATTGALVATLNNPQPSMEDHFGWSVAIDGNLAVVGARFDDPGGAFNAGTAYSFDATTGAWLGTLNNPETVTGSDAFGYSVGISGALAVAGAPFDSPGFVIGAGTSHVFGCPTATPTATASPTATFEPSPTPSPTATPTPSYTPLPPTIIFQPPDQAANPGQNIVFNVVAMDPLAPSLAANRKEAGLMYQWLKDSQPIDGQTMGSLSLASVTEVDEAVYNCQVAGPGGTMPSRDAALTVFDPPVANGAQYVAHSAPPSIAAGQEVLVGIVMRNASALTWSAPQGYALAVTDDPSGLFQGVTRLYFAEATQVIPAAGGLVQFVGALRAPAALGPHAARLRMIEENVEVFGEEAVITIQSVEAVNATPDWTAYE